MFNREKKIKIEYKKTPKQRVIVAGSIVLALLVLFLLGSGITGYIIYGPGEIIEETFSFDKQPLPLGSFIEVTVNSQVFTKNIASLIDADPEEIEYEQAIIWGYDSSVELSLSDFEIILPEGEHIITTSIIYDGNVLDTKNLEVIIQEDTEPQEQIQETQEEPGEIIEEAKSMEVIPEQQNDVIIVLKENAKEKKQLLKIKDEKEKLEEKKINIEEKQGDLLYEVDDSEFDVEKEFDTINAITATVTDNKLQELQNHPDVEAVIPNTKLNLFLAESLPIINADDVHNLNIDGLDESVCIIDTGVDPTHPDLAANILAQQCYCDDDTDPGNGGCCPDGSIEQANSTDANGHGTHVSGIAAANGLVTGVAKNGNIVSVKVFGKDRTAYLSDILAGIDFCINNKDVYNISVITMSLGTSVLFNNIDNCEAYIPAFTDAVNAAASLGIVTMAASGNDGSTNGIALPACLGNVVSVGATTDSDTIASYTNRDELLDLLAPGSNIYSTAQRNCPPGGIGQVCDNSRYITLSGTSMATPHVAGAVLLLRQYSRLNNLSLTNHQLVEVLKNTGVIVSDSGIDFPRIDILAAINSLEQEPNQPKYENFKNNLTTNFSSYNETELQSLSNVVVGVPDKAKIDYGFNSLNVLGVDFDSAVSIGENFVSVDSVLAPSLNKSATLTFYNVSLSNPQILMEGQPCPPSVCTNFAVNGNEVTADVAHFTNYTLVGNTQLLIFDDADIILPANRSVGVIVKFYANYSNSTNNQPINNTMGGSCNISFDVLGPNGSMIYNPTSTFWEFNRTFFSLGLINWSVNCSAPGFNTINLVDDINIVPDCVDLDNPSTYNGKVVRVVDVLGSYNYFINQNTTLCRKTYFLNDFGDDSVIFINNSDIFFDCNGSVLLGNISLPLNGIGTNAIVSRDNNNVIIRNCNIKNFSDGISVFGTATGFKILNNNITDLIINSTPTGGVDMDGMRLEAASAGNSITNFLVANNTVARLICIGSNCEGIFGIAFGAKGNYQNNIIINNKVSGVSAFGGATVAGIGILSDNGILSNNLVANNFVFNISALGFALGIIENINIDQIPPSTNDKIINNNINQIVGGAGFGIGVMGASNVNVTNNSVCNTTALGIASFDGNIIPQRQTLLYNNSLCSNFGLGKIGVLWLAQIRARKCSQNLNNVTINITQVDGSLVYANVTNISGLTPRIEFLIEYVINNSNATINFTPHNISGYSPVLNETAVTTFDFIRSKLSTRASPHNEVILNFFCPAAPRPSGGGGGGGGGSARRTVRSTGSTCGDGICDPWENEEGCLQDCRKPVVTQPTPQPKEPEPVVEEITEEPEPIVEPEPVIEKPKQYPWYWLLLLLFLPLLLLFNKGKTEVKKPVSKEVNKKVLDYIQSCISSGLSLDKIEDKLKKAGWSDDEIKSAVEYYKQSR